MPGQHPGAAAPGGLPAPLGLRAFAAALAVKLRALAPYAVMELVLPGGSLMAILLWLYRRQKKSGCSRIEGHPLF